MATKHWDIDPSGEMEIFEKDTNVYLCLEFPNNPENDNLPTEIKELIEQSNKNTRLIFVNKQPIEEVTEIIFGWEYIFESENWVRRKFIETENKFGLFDEDRTWFDFVNGNPVIRDGLYPDKFEIMKLWNE